MFPSLGWVQKIEKKQKVITWTVKSKKIIVKESKVKDLEKEFMWNGYDMSKKTITMYMIKERSTLFASKQINKKITLMKK